MKITRDVIYDLLPAYFANEVSPDTRALVEEYFATDPEFAKMAARFSALVAEKSRPGEADVAAARERESFDRVRAAAELPQKTRAAALVWGFASLFSFVMAMLTWNARMGFFNPGVLMGICFGFGAILTFVLSFRIKPDSWWRGMAGLDDETLRSFGPLGRRRGRS